MTKKIVGQVYRLDKKNQRGTIISRDNQQYSFSLKDSGGVTEIKDGHLVEFTAEGKTAKNIKLSMDPAKK